MTGPNTLNLDHSVINLLVIDHSLAEAEPIAQALRTAGFLVQPTCSDQRQDIETIIAVKSIDAILLRLRDSLPDVAAVRGQITASNKDIPIIVLYDSEQTPHTLSLLQAGADAVCPSDDSELTLLFLRKELAHQQLREQLRSLEAQLQETEARSRKLLDDASDAVAYIHEGAHVYANTAYSKLFGYDSADDLLGVTLMDLIDPQYHDSVKSVLRNTIKTGQEQLPLAILAMGKNNQTFPATIVCTPTRIDGEPCLQMLVRTESTAASTETDTRSDFNTNITIHTRAAFTQYIDNMLEAGLAEGAVFYILLNEHRTICQSLGLDAGDVLINDIAEQLAAHTTQNDLIARIADAVFAVYVRNADPQTVNEIGLRLQQTIDDNVSHYNKRLISTKASVGICLVSGYYQTALDILNHANEACEIARQDHSERVVVYKLDASELDHESQEVAVVAVIEDAIAAGRIYMMYQPIASFQGESDNRYHVSLEVLDAEQQPFPLENFHAIAERHQLMLKLDRWAIANAIKAIAQRPTDPPTRLFLPLSVNSLDDAKFLHWLETSLTQAGIKGSALVLEISEFAAERYFESVRPLRDELKRLQCGFALTEFASGQHTQRLLQNLKPDIVKLNTDLIERLSRSRNEDTAKHLSEMTELAQQAEVQIIAINVSTPQQMASIWQYGAAMAQGPVVANPSRQMDFDFSQFSG